MIHNGTRLVAEAFDLNDIKYRITELSDISIVEAGVDVEAGPQVIARFISKDNDNDVAVRVYNLICKVPATRRPEVLEACSTLNGKYRCFKFYLNDEAGVNVEADLPLEIGDDCLGACCVELFVRLMQVLNDGFPILAHAVYMGVDTEKQRGDELLSLLSELQERTIPTFFSET